MIFGTKKYKNGKSRGVIEFSTGKKVILKDRELKEFETWVYSRVAHGGMQGADVHAEIKEVIG